jgi:hypothetical protein
MTMTFTELLTAANESKTGRKPGQWTPTACKTWRERSWDRRVCWKRR